MDSQCYVLGAAQQGWHGEQRQTWGHAGIADSRGQLLQSIDTEGHGLISSNFDLEQQNQLRLAMPLMQHRKIIHY